MKSIINIRSKKTLEWSLLFLSALFLVLTLPPFDLGWMMLFALVPLFLFVEVSRENPQKVFWGAVGVGTVYVVKVLFPLASLNAWWWVPENYLLWQSKSVLLYILLAFVAITFGGLFFGFFFSLYRKYGKRSFPSVLAFPAVWVLFEALRAKILFGFTWGAVGYAFHGVLPLLQLAWFGKVYGLGFFALVINMLFAAAFFETLVGKNKKRKASEIFFSFCRSRRLQWALLILLVSGIYGYAAMSAPLSKSKTFSLAVIHSTSGTGETLGEKGFNLYMKLVDDSLSSHPDLVVFPENTFPFFVIDESTKLPLNYTGADGVIKTLYDELTARSRANPEVSFAIGMHTEKDKKRYNSLVIMEDGEITSIYNKRRLMPFSEDNLGLVAESSVESLFSGAEHQRVLVKGFPITALICSEIIMPELSMESGSKMIINASNDGVFGSALLSDENHIMAEVRAAEHRVYLARSVKNGIASVIDPFGRVVTSAEGNVSGVLTAKISL